MPSLSRARRSVGQPLQLGLDLGEHLRVEQLAQLGATEQLGEQPRVEGERGGPAFGDGGVALVHERGDVAEQQRLRERRRRWVLTSTSRSRALGDALVQRDQRGQVVDVLQHLADRLEHDRERRVARATSSSCAERCRCCHSGARRPGSRRGSSRARAAHSRKREANSADPPTSVVTICSISSGSNAISSAPGGSWSVSGMRSTMPSSVAIACASMP